MECAYHCIFFDPDDGRLCGRAGRRQMEGLPGKASLTEKLTGIQHRDDAFLALFRYDGDLNSAGPTIEDRIGRVALSEDGLPPFVRDRGPSYLD